MIKGYGLHTGVFSEVQFHLAEGPVRFLRQGVEITVDVDQVIGTQRCTTLGANSERISLVEHLLAALHIKGWWRGLIIEVSNQELPILDGSAEGWLEAIEALGEPPENPTALELKNEITMADGASVMTAKPAEQTLHARVNYDHPAIGEQSWQGPPKDYKELLNARTFGFLHELEYLKSQGLASHASLENAIVFGETAALQDLRHENEPVRHKALDALGDLFLLGRPLNAAVTVERGSHKLHVDFVKKLRNQSMREAWENAS